MNDLTYAGEHPEVLPTTAGLYAVWLHIENGRWRVLRLSCMPNYPPSWACVAIAESRFGAVSLAISLYKQER